MNELPFSPAAERNAQPIQEVLDQVLIEEDRVLEIGSGTGQHAVHMARAFPQVLWQASDRAENIPAIAARIRDADLPNLPDPLTLDVLSPPWPALPTTVLFTANTFHIMPAIGWRALIDHASNLLDIGGRIVVYGPFRARGRELEPSNLRFEQMLQGDAPHRGIRCQEDVIEFAETRGFVLQDNRAMPANNRCLVWVRKRIEPLGSFTTEEQKS